MRIAKTPKCPGSGRPRSRELMPRLRARWSSLRRDELARGRRSAVQSPALAASAGWASGDPRSAVRAGRGSKRGQGGRSGIRDPASRSQPGATAPRASEVQDPGSAVLTGPRGGEANVRGPRSGGAPRVAAGGRSRSKIRRPKSRAVRASGRASAIRDPPARGEGGSGGYPRSAVRPRAGKGRGGVEDPCHHRLHSLSIMAISDIRGLTVRLDGKIGHHSQFKLSTHFLADARH